MSVSETIYPVLDWLEANGIKRTDVAFEPVTVVGDTIVWYRAWWDEEHPYALHGDRVLPRQMVTPMTVPPEPGLLASAVLALRAALLEDLIREVITYP